MRTSRLWLKCASETGHKRDVFFFHPRPRRRLAAEGRQVGRHDYDSYLARFSRARKRDVDKAYKMLVECLDWRAENKVDTIYEWWEKDPEFSKMLTYYPYHNWIE